MLAKNSICISILLCLFVNFLFTSTPLVEGSATFNWIFTKDQQLQVEQLFSRRASISTYLGILNNEINDASDTTDNAFRLSFASDVTGKSFLTSIPGTTSQDVDQLYTMFSQQYMDLQNYTQGLLLKKKVLQDAIKVLDTQILLQYNNGSRINRFASTDYGTVVLLSNNSLVYIGKYETTFKNQGFVSADNTVRTLKTPSFVDMSPIPGKTVIDVQSSFANNFIILTLDGEVWGWGHNADNALGTGTPGVQAIMTRPDFGSIIPTPLIKKIKCGDTYNGCFMISSDGKLLFMGSMDFTASIEKWSKPRLISTNDTDGIVHGVVDIAFSPISGVPKSVCFISSITSLVYCSGDNSQGQLGDGTITTRTPGASPTTSSSPIFSWRAVQVTDTKFVKIIAGSQFFMALSTEGKLYSWGTSDFRLGRKSLVNTVPYVVPGQVSTPFMIRNVCSSPTRTTVIVSDFNDVVYTIGSYNNDDIPQFYKPTVLGERTFSEISCGDVAIFLVPSKTNSVWAMGKNTNYQLGVDGSTSTFPYLFEAPFVPNPYTV